MLDDKKDTLTKLFKNTPGLGGGKYLVIRRDNTVPEWPWFVLGARDPMAPVALRAYADEAQRLGKSQGWIDDIRKMADEWDEYRKTQGEGDPDKGRHRVDCPAVIERMMEGKGA